MRLTSCGVQPHAEPLMKGTLPGMMARRKTGNAATGVFALTTATKLLTGLGHLRRDIPERFSSVKTSIYEGLRVVREYRVHHRLWPVAVGSSVQS